MKILVTGAKGFVGKNLCAQLNTIKDGQDNTAAKATARQTLGRYRRYERRPNAKGTQLSEKFLESALLVPKRWEVKYR